MSKHLILTMSAVALAACGDKGGSDDDPTFTGGSETTTATTMTVTDASADDESTDTIAPESSSEGGTTATTDTDNTTGATNDLITFRVNAFALRDPHLIFEGDDVTIDSVNAPWNVQINADATNDMLLDFGLVLLFRPLDQTDGAMGEFYLSNGACTFPADETTTCDPAQGTTASASMYQMTGVGPCLTPIAEELSDYPVPPEPPTGTPGPCFTSGPSLFTLRNQLMALPMSNVQVAAQLIGDPAENLAQGNIQGFLSAADADLTMVTLPVVGTMPISDLLDPDDMDGDGWRMYFAFTAVPSVWTGPTD
jgi:hypothetical protein